VGGVELLALARRVGLTVTERDNLLVIRGPIQHEALAQQLLAAKADVLAALRAAPSPWSGLSEEAKQALERYGWEPVDGVAFPDDSGDDSSVTTSVAKEAKMVRAPLKGVLDVG
jgi:hypothetical protein